MHALRLLSLGAALALAPSALAQVWTENGDAGNLPGSAQVCDGVGAITSITGNINDPTEALGPGNDKDIYLIRIANPAAFTATTNGGSAQDTQLFLFNASGRGVTFNDDSAPNVTSLITGQFVTAPGRYYLAISHYDRDATAGGLAIWLDGPFTSERQPDGPGAAGAIDGWVGNTSPGTDTAPYTITLTGCEFVTPTTMEIYVATSSTSRGSNTGGACEVLQGWHGSHWGCLGDSGASSSLIGLTYITQDQNASTIETYDVVVRSGTDAAGPTLGAPGELGVITGLSTPLGGNPPAAWQITADFATPVALPEKDFFATGLRFAAAAWTADGQSLHNNSQALQQSGPHQEDHAWQIQAGVVSHPTVRRSWRTALRLATPVLQNGVFATTTTTYARGMGGMFPPVGTHGWSTHIRGGSTYAAGFVAPFLGTARLPAGVPIAGISGSLCISGTIVPLPLFPLDAAGNANIPLIDPVPLLGPSTVHMQAVVVSATFANIAFTNSNGTTFQ